MPHSPPHPFERKTSISRLALLFGVTVGATFFFECAIMLALPHVMGPNSSAVQSMLVDASLLTLGLSVVFLPASMALRRRDLEASQRAIRIQHALDLHAIVSIADISGRITHVNHQFCEISGYDATELIGQNHRILKSGHHSPDFFKAMWGDIATGKVWRGEVCNRTKSGGHYWVKSTIVPYVNARGNVEEYVSIRTDITAQKRMELALREHEAWLETILANIGEGVYVVDRSGKLTFLNKGAERLIGWSLAELRGTSIHDAIHHHRPDGQPLLAKDCLIACAVRENQVYRSRDEVFFRKDGSRFPVSVTAAPLFFDDNWQGTVAVFSDRTPEIEAQRELVDARENALSASRAKSEFLSHMSHELRTPLNAILGFAEVLEADRRLDPELRPTVREIVHGGSHLLAMINDILDLAKIESGRVAISLEPVRIQDVVNSCLGMTEPLIKRTQLRVSVSVPDDLAVRADQTRLKQVLMNLIANATKYSPMGGTLSVHAEANAQNLARIVVTDSGKGISKDHLDAVFEPFNRGGAEATGIEGTGIGLSISRKLVELMGGRMGVDSRLGMGSQFWIDLHPEIVAKTASSIKSVMPQAAPDQVCGRVLYVDDNPINLRLVAQFLEQRDGITLLTAETSAKGLQLAASECPDVILLDINMPDLDGYQMLTQLKANPNTASIPVAAVSANAMPADVERGLAAGFDHYITKPIRLLAFLTVIDTMML